MADAHGVTFALDGIGHLLKDRTFKVPFHQRSYKWERAEHVRQLFNDVQDAMRDPDADGYFLGMIVLKAGNLPADRLEIIDGQQRLATVSIFLAAIRNYFQKQGDSGRANHIHFEYIADQHGRSQNEDSKLHLNIEDRRFFDDHVVKGLPVAAPKKGTLIPESNRRIHDAILEAAERVEDIALGSPETAGERLFDWVDYFLHKARVVAITVPEEQNAYSLFETLNDRGLELTKADLIKNHLFSRASNRLDEVRQFWTEMNTALDGEEETVDYIRHYWASKHEHVRTKQLYAVVKKKTHGPLAAYEEASLLRQDARLYSALMNADAALWREYGDTTREHVRTLLTVGVSVLRPLQLSVLRSFPRNEVVTAFRLFVNWSVRFLIVGGHRSEAVEVPLSDVAIEVSNSKINTAPKMAKELSSVIPKDDVFRAAFAAASVSKHALARYYLRAIEDHKAKSPHPEWIAQPNADKVDLEHVLPLNPKAEWKLPKEEDTAVLHNRIGNLALLTRAVNTDIGNGTLDEKRAAYAASSFVFTNWIASQAKWGATEIEARQEMLADEVATTWPLRFW